MLQDERGLDVGTDSQPAIEALDHAMRRYFEYRLDTGAAVKQVIAADPQMAMGHVFMGYLMMLFGTNTVLDKARRHLRDAEAHLHRASERERLHTHALRAWIEGDLVRTCGLLDEILFEHPRDLPALRLHHHLQFWMGRPFGLRNQAAGVLDAPLDHSEVMDTGERVRGTFIALIGELVATMAAAE